MRLRLMCSGRFVENVQDSVARCVSFFSPMTKDISRTTLQHPLNNQAVLHTQESNFISRLRNEGYSNTALIVANGGSRSVRSQLF